MKVKDIVEANYWKADKTYRQKRLPGLEPDPVDNADRFDASTHDQADDHNPEIDVNNAQMRAAITQLLLKLSPRMERMLRERFFQGLTLEQISQKYGISRERIRQIEAKALRILKHPSRSKQLKSMLQTSTSEAANPAQQAAIAISMKKAGKKPKKETDEAKQRLDPKCWTGYHKAGTKMKGGIRVNNCVKDESVEESSGHIPKNSKEAHDPRWSNALTVDIGPGEDKKQSAKMGFSISDKGPPRLNTNGKF